MAKGKAAAVGAVAGGFICLGLTLFSIAAMVVLSLIASYTTSNAAQGSGAEYRVNALMMKGIYQNNTYTYYNGTVADSATLSSLCTTTYTKLGATAFSNCVLTNLLAYGRYNSSNTARRRRRATDEAGLYITGYARIFFSTSCEKVADRSKYGSDSSLSKCASTRLSVCNSFMNQTSFTSWTPVPSGFALSAVDSSSSGYQSLSISRIFLIPIYMAQTYVTPLGLGSSFSSKLTSGCQYIAPISISDIAAIVSAQSSGTTTQPTTNSIG